MLMVIIKPRSLILNHWTKEPKTNQNKNQIIMRDLILYPLQDQTLMIVSLFNLKCQLKNNH